jgi:hypothetical protein
MTDKPILTELTNADVYKAVMEKNPIEPARPLEILTDAELIEMHEVVMAADDGLAQYRRFYGDASRAVLPSLNELVGLRGLVVAERYARNHDF